jgi:hypothetical protein
MLAADDDECWPWPYNTWSPPQSPWYEIGMWRGTTATRAILARVTGWPSDPTLEACHEPTCDLRPLCVNPKHLYWGTRQQNIDDQIDTGTRSQGGKHYNARFDDDVALELIAAEGTAAEIGRRFGVAPSTVADIKYGRTRKHLDRSGMVPLRRKVKVTDEMAIAVIPDPREHHLIAADHGIGEATVSGIKHGTIKPHLDRSNVVINPRGGSREQRQRRRKRYQPPAPEHLNGLGEVA